MTGPAPAGPFLSFGQISKQLCMISRLESLGDSHFFIILRIRSISPTACAAPMAEGLRLGGGAADKFPTVGNMEMTQLLPRSGGVFLVPD